MITRSIELMETSRGKKNPVVSMKDCCKQACKGFNLRPSALSKIELAYQTSNMQSL